MALSAIVLPVIALITVGGPIALAIFSPEAIFNRVLFAWQALAAAFGPLLIVTLWRGPVQPNWRIAAMVCGFVLTVMLNWLADTPGDIAERYIPLIAALVLALMGAPERSMDSGITGSNN